MPYVEPKKEVAAIFVEPEHLPYRGNYSYDIQQIKDYICKNSEMFFYSNPNAKDPDSPLYEKYDTKINLNCSIFEEKDHNYIVHYFFS